MAKSEVIVGLDVGTTKVCAVVGEIRKGGVDLLGHGLVPCEGLNKGAIVDIDATTAAIEAAVEMAQQATGYQIRTVAVGISGEHIRSLTGKGVVNIQGLGDITDEDVSQAMDAAQQGATLPSGSEVIHNIPRLFTVDGHQGIRRPVGMTGTLLETETHLVTAQTSALQNLIKCVHKADLSIMPGGIIFAPLATAAAVLSREEQELGVALVDIGGGTSDVALFRMGSAFYSSVIPVGGNHVSNDLAVGLRVARAEAERIKRVHGTALSEDISEEERVAVPSLSQEEGETNEVPRRFIAQIIEARMEELFELVRAEIAKADALGLLPAGVVLSGGSSQMPGVLEVAQRVLEAPVRLGAPTHPAAATSAMCSPAFGAGVGLVLYAGRHQRPEAKHGERSLLSAVFSNIAAWVRRVLSG